MKIPRVIPRVISVVLAICLQITDAGVFEEWGQSSATVPYIVGGSIVNKPGLYPWHVAILHRENYIGGGSLISQQFVLTVTHVTYDHFENPIDPKRLSIKAGIIKLTDDKKADSYEVAEILRYPNYNSENLMNDICMLKVDGIVSFNKFVRPIYLWDKSDEVLTKLADKKHKGTVIGFGLTEASGKRNNDLRSASVVSIETEECIKSFKGFKDVLSEDRNFCVKDADATVCRGDSGSGMVYYVQQRQAYYLRGLVSQGHAACSKGTAAVFTDIGHYLKWIERTALPTVYNLLGIPTCDEPSYNGTQVSLSGLVTLKYAFRKSLFISDCHGVLITKKHVLTQAKCAIDNGLRKLHAVSIGSPVINDFSQPATQYPIMTVSVKDELAIITLQKEVEDSYRPVCLPTRLEEGTSSVLYWQRQTKHPKYLQRTVILERKQMVITNELFNALHSSDTNNLRLGGTPLFYTTHDLPKKHFYLRALEKCPIQGCSEGQPLAFVDVLKYKKWIIQKAGQYMNYNLLTPELDD